jgi:hypothetical protein
VVCEGSYLPDGLWMFAGQHRRAGGRQEPRIGLRRLTMTTKKDLTELGISFCLTGSFVILLLFFLHYMSQLPRPHSSLASYTSGGQTPSIRPAKTGLVFQQGTISTRDNIGFREMGLPLSFPSTGKFPRVLVISGAVFFRWIAFTTVELEAGWPNGFFSEPRPTPAGKSLTSPTIRRPSLRKSFTISGESDPRRWTVNQSKERIRQWPYASASKSQHGTIPPSFWESTIKSFCDQ